MTGEMVGCNPMAGEQREGRQQGKEKKQSIVRVVFAVGDGDAVRGRGPESPDGGRWRWLMAVRVCGGCVGRWPEQRKEAEESEEQERKEETMRASEIEYSYL